MANITKNQIRARLKKIVEKLEEERSNLEDLKTDIDNELEEIEPYEGKFDLTPQQEERQESLENWSSVIDDQISSLEEMISNLEEDQ